MADFKIKYGAETAITCDVSSLASSSSRTAGRASTVVDNTSNLYDDAIVSGKIRTGTSPTVSKQIDVWVYAQRNDTPTYPDGITGSDAAKTMTSENVRNSALRLACSILVDATSDRDYDIAPFAVAALFGGIMPRRWGLFVAHDTAVALNATAGNHEFKYSGIHYQSV